MQKRIVEKLISVLEQHFSEFQWYGRRLGKAPLSLRGSFTAHTTHIHGFEIVIALHNYHGKGFPTGVPRGVSWRRKIPGGVLKWIEITIEDANTRFGRRSIIKREPFIPKSEEYARMRLLFRKINKVSTMFDPKATSRLSEDQALLGFCKEIEK